MAQDRSQRLVGYVAVGAVAVATVGLQPGRHVLGEVAATQRTLRRLGAALRQGLAHLERHHGSQLVLTPFELYGGGGEQLRATLEAGPAPVGEASCAVPQRSLDLGVGRARILLDQLLGRGIESSILHASCFPSARRFLLQYARRKRLQRPVGDPHAQCEQRDQSEVGCPHRQASVRGDIEVTLPRPADRATQSEQPEQQDQEQDWRVRHEEHRDAHRVSDDPDPAADHADDSTAVQRADRDQVEQVDQETRRRQRVPEQRSRGPADDQADQRADAAQHRPADADQRLDVGIAGQALHGDDRPDEGDEHRRAGVNALLPHDHDVAHLVHEDQQDEADRERQAPQQRVGPDRQRHAQQSAELGELEQGHEELQLAQRKQQQGADRTEGNQQPFPRRRRTGRGAVDGLSHLTGRVVACDRLEIPQPPFVLVRPTGLVHRRINRPTRAVRASSRPGI